MSKGDCPLCQLGVTTFGTSKHIGGGFHSRKRKCLSCGHRFMTLESPSSEEEIAEKIADNLLPGSEKRIEKRLLPQTAIKSLRVSPKVRSWMEGEINKQGLIEFLTSLVVDAYYEENGDD